MYGITSYFSSIGLLSQEFPCKNYDILTDDTPAKWLEVSEEQWFAERAHFTTYCLFLLSTGYISQCILPV